MCAVAREKKGGRAIAVQKKNIGRQNTSTKLERKQALRQTSGTAISCSLCIYLFCGERHSHKKKTVFVTWHLATYSEHTRPTNC